MRIVIITHYFPPEVNAPAQRAYDHAKVWASQGHDVIVMTAAPSHPYGELYEGYENHTHEEDVEGVRVLRLKTTLGANSGVAKRAINYASFLLAVTMNAHRIDGADVVISTSPHFLCGLAGFPVSRRASAKWVLEIRDIWPESIVAVGAARPGLIMRLLSATADWAYRTCDHMISVSPGFAPHFEARGVEPEKITLIPNGINQASESKPSSSFDDFPAVKKLQGRQIAAYVGTLGMAHGVSTILEAAQLLENNREIGFLLVGGGAERDVITAKAREMKLDNLVILDQVSRDQVLGLFSLIDISIVHLKKQDVFKTVIPTKLLEGMAMGKPIALGVEGVARDILIEANAGIAFEPECSEGLAEAVLRLSNDKTAARAMGAAGNAHVADHFNRSKLALAYLERLQGITGKESQ